MYNTHFNGKWTLQEPSIFVALPLMRCKKSEVGMSKLSAPIACCEWVTFTYSSDDGRMTSERIPVSLSSRNASMWEPGYRLQGRYLVAPQWWRSCATCSHVAVNTKHELLLTTKSVGSVLTNNKPNPKRSKTRNARGKLTKKTKDTGEKARRTQYEGKLRRRGWRRGRIQGSGATEMFGWHY